MKQFILLGFLVCFLQPIFAQQTTDNQPIIRVYESKLYKANAPQEHLIKDNGIAEINGTLLMKIDQEAIKNRMLGFSGVKQADIHLISKYKNILANKIKTLNLLQEGLAAANGQPDFKKLAELSILLDDFYTTLLSDAELRNMAAKADAEYNQKVNAGAIDPASYTDDMYFVEYFGQEAEAVLAKLDDAEKLRFIMTGSIRSKSTGAREVTLGGDFDQIPEEIYEVPRWTFTLSDAQKDELRAVAQLSNKLDTLRLSSTKNAKSAFFSAITCKECLDSLKSQLKALPTSIEGLKDSVIARATDIVKPLQDELIRMQDQYFQVPSAAQGLNSATDLSSFNDNLIQLDAFSKSFFKSLPKSLESLPPSLLNTPQVQAIIDLQKSCKNQIKADINKFYTLFESIKAMFGGSNAEQAFHNTISDQVKRLAIADIPMESFIDLNKTGKRANGDQLVLEAYLENEQGNGVAKRQSIYRQSIDLQQIALYSEVKINMILANPVPDLLIQRREYTFAPSYSVLFRWGSRKSHFYNNFLNIGLGANFSAPDFSLDGVPEFAVAATFSTFKDFISIGYGYNFGADAKFMFIGFRVPFASAALPILNSVEN